MKYKAILTNSAFKELNSLEKNTKKRIIEKIKLFSADPITYSRKLSNPIIGEYRFRIGDYRVVFDIDEDKIVILKIGHRKEIYK